MKGQTWFKLAAAGTVLILGALLLGSALNVEPLNILETDDGCWRPAPEHNNNSFDSEEELRDYASQRDFNVPENISFKIINGTLYQEAECIGGNSG